jgi:hypothetical protein
MYKCSPCGSKDKFVSGIIGVTSTGEAKRMYITHCSECNKYYFYETLTANIDSEPVKRIELTKEEAMDLIVKMKCCTDPNDTFCNLNVHRFINSFRTINDHRVVAI